jgi:hypothetical protein
MLITIYPVIVANDQTRGVTLVKISEIATILGSVGAATFLGLFPQYWLYRVLDREKSRFLNRLAAEIDSLQKERKWNDTFGAKVALYAAASATPDYPIDRQGLIQYVTAGVVLVTPYLVQAIVA